MTFISLTGAAFGVWGFLGASYDAMPVAAVTGFEEFASFDFKVRSLSLYP